MKQIIPIMLGILLISLCSAIYPGESQLYLPSDVGLDSFTSIDIRNNISFIGYEFNESWINLTIPADVVIQNFTIIFNGYAQGIESVVEVPSSSGGRPSYGSGICYRGYKTSEWSVCNASNSQSRIVSIDSQTCYQTKQIKPLETQTCPIIPENNTIIAQEPIKESKEFFLWTWLKWLLNKIQFWKW